MNIERLFWVLEYDNGNRIHEILEGWSIKNGEKNPLYLHIYNVPVIGEWASASHVATIELDSEMCAPIFYRVRGITLDGSGKTTTDAVVFGKAGEEKAEISVASPNGMLVGNDAGQYFDFAAILSTVRAYS